MTAIFAFDEIDEHLPRVRRNTASSVNSSEDHWFHNTQHTEDFSDSRHSRVHHFAVPWDRFIIAEEDDGTTTPHRVGTPPIPIPNGSSNAQRGDIFGSVEVGFDAQVRGEGLDRKMVPSDFEPVRVLGKGAYGTVLLVRHKVSGRLFAQKQLKKSSLIVRTKDVGT